MYVQEMISTHPQVRGSVDDALIRCIEACYDCAQTCTSCADACLAEGSVKELTQCIRLDLDCADICEATGKVASRRTATNEFVLKSIIETCADACRMCAEECERHKAMEHCRVCAEACRRCEKVCREVAQTISPTVQ